MKKLLTALLIAFSLASFGQFKMLNYTGNVLLESDTGHSKVKIGQSLETGSKILSKGQFTILDKDNKAHTYGEGIFTLDSVPNSNVSNIAMKYIDYILNDMVKKEYTRDMSLTGSVERSTAEYDIKTYYPNKSYISDRTVVHWHQYLDVNKYNVKVYNMFDQPIIDEVIKDTSIVLYFATNYSEDLVYRLVITDKDSEIKSKSVILECPSKTLMFKVDRQISKYDDYKKDYMYYYVIGKVYEENALFFDAIENYYRSLRLNPTLLVESELNKFN